MVPAQHAGHALETGVAVFVILGKDGDFRRPYPTDLDQVLDRGSGFLGVAGPVVEYVPVRRILAQERGAGERPEEEHLLLQCIGDGHRGGRSTDVSDNAKYFAAL